MQGRARLVRGQGGGIIPSGKGRNFFCRKSGIPRPSAGLIAMRAIEFHPGVHPENHPCHGPPAGDLAPVAAILRPSLRETTAFPGTGVLSNHRLTVSMPRATAALTACFRLIRSLSPTRLTDTPARDDFLADSNMMVPGVRGRPGPGQSAAPQHQKGTASQAITSKKSFETNGFSLANPIPHPRKLPVP